VTLHGIDRVSKLLAYARQTSGGLRTSHVRNTAGVAVLVLNP
jgi:hypothetical protein